MTLDLEKLRDYMDRAHLPKMVSVAEKAELRETLPLFVSSITPQSVPKSVKLPAGGSVTSGTRMTAVRSFSLLLARRAFGKTYYKVDPSFEALAREVLFGVMRHHYMHDAPKGLFCCATCSLSLLPLYAADSFRYIDCREAEANVREALETGTELFRSGYPKPYAEWSLAASRH